jgi:hypothetical protein
MAPWYCPLDCGKKLANSMSDKDRVFILTSFIDAHKHAHDAVLFYLGEHEGETLISFLQL